MTPAVSPCLTSDLLSQSPVFSYKRSSVPFLFICVSSCVKCELVHMNAVHCRSHSWSLSLGDITDAASNILNFFMVLLPACLSFSSYLWLLPCQDSFMSFSLPVFVCHHTLYPELGSHDPAHISLMFHIVYLHPCLQSDSLIERLPAGLCVMFMSISGHVFSLSVSLSHYLSSSRFFLLLWSFLSLSSSLFGGCNDWS